MHPTWGADINMTYRNSVVCALWTIVRRAEVHYSWVKSLSVHTVGWNLKSIVNIVKLNRIFVLYICRSLMENDEHIVSRTFMTESSDIALHTGPNLKWKIIRDTNWFHISSEHEFLFHKKNRHVFEKYTVTREVESLVWSTEGIPLLKCSSLI